jgi:excisionase family DNA binding protein
MQGMHDVNSAAKLLLVSPWTIRAWIRDGKLRPVRLGRLVRIEEAELTRFIRQAGGHDVLGNEAKEAI